MSQPILTQLPPSLLNVLKAGCPALLLTVGTDGFSHTAYTWLVALNPTTLRLAVDHGSTTLANLERERRAALQIIGPGGLTFLIKGTTSLVKPQIDAAPFKVALMSLETQWIKDQSWSGVTIQPLTYEWAPEQREQMLAMEQAIYTEMRTEEG